MMMASNLFVAKTAFTEAEATAITNIATDHIYTKMTIVVMGREKMPIDLGDKKPVPVYLMTEDGTVIGEGTTYIHELAQSDGVEYSQSGYKIDELTGAFDCCSFTMEMADDSLRQFIKAIARSYLNNWRKMHGLPKIRRRKR